ncbi:hypothetical protein T492DRAFT_928418, partial [Pavlovales sp. CCMP2436]
MYQWQSSVTVDARLGRLQVRGWRQVRSRGEAHQVDSRRCPSDEGGAFGQATARAPNHSSKTSETTHGRAWHGRLPQDGSHQDRRGQARASAPRSTCTFTSSEMPTSL